MSATEKTGIQIDFGDDKIELVKGAYEDGKLAIEAYDITDPEDDSCYGEQWGDISVNLIAPLSEENAIYLDENNLGRRRVEIIAKLGRLTGNEEASGWCTYPEFVFDAEVLTNMRDIFEFTAAFESLE